MLCPTLALSEARTLCTDIAALYVGSRAELSLPVDDERRGGVHYDELVRAQLVLTLPAVPSKLPPPEGGEGSASVLARDGAGLPPLLVTLLRSLQISLHGAYAESDESRAPLFTRRWHGGASNADFVLRDDTERGLSESRTPLTDPSYTSGVSYDADAKAWRVYWLSDVFVAYPNGDPGIERLHLRADLQLRIDLAQLVACIDAPPPQTPFHFTSSEVHTMVTSADPYFVDVDLLATLTEGVTVPDETAEQRHGHIASKIGLLPLSVLVPRATGVEVVAPWSQAVSLSQGLARAKDIETAAMASDADIALAPLATTLGRSKERLRPTLGRQSSVPAPGSDDRVLAQDVATAAAAGIVVVTRHAEAFTDVLPTLYVRMRALGRAHVVGQDAGVPTPPRSLLLSVELESTLPSCAYIVHALDITLGEPLEADGAGSVANELITPVIEAVQRDAPTFPIRIEPRAQHNVLYSARLEELQGAPDALARALAQWSPRRKVRVSVRGTPARTETAGEASTCASQWNGTIDLSAVQIEQQRRLLATAAVLDATGYDGRHSAPLVEQPKPLVAGDAQYTASALAQHAVHEKAGPAPPPKDRKRSSTRAASVPSPLSMSYLDEAKRRAERPAPFAAAPAPRHSAERHAYAWGRGDLHAETLDGALRRSEERAPGAEDRTLLASIHVVPEHPTSEAMTSVPCCSTLTIHVELFNVAARPMEAILSWDAAEGDTSSLAPSALLVDVSEVHVGATLGLCAVTPGRHSLGALHVRDAHTGLSCVLHNLGSVYVQT